MGYLLFELAGIRKVRSLYLKCKHSLGWILVRHKHSIIAQMKVKMKIRVKKKKMMMMMMMMTKTTGGRVKCTAQPLSRNDRG